MDNTDDDFQRIQRNKDLRVTGFAAKENEDLYDIYKNIAAAIGFNVGQYSVMPSIERIKTYNKTTKQFIQSPTILLHFAILRQKQQFYALYLSKMPLDPTPFGLAADNRIVVSENLTKMNAQIFKQALTHKKNKIIAQAYTEDGIVKIKFNKGKTEISHTVRSITTLETIIMQHQQTSQFTAQTPNTLNNNNNKPVTATPAPATNNSNTSNANNTRVTGASEPTVTASTAAQTLSTLPVNNNDKNTEVLHTPMETNAGA